MKYDVFISYARASTLKEANDLRQAIEKKGITVFIDDREISPGNSFPNYIADSLLKSKLMVVFADETYFQRPWCVYEFIVGVAPYRATARTDKADIDSLMEHLIITFPPVEDISSMIPHLPPPIAEKNWPKADETGRLARLVANRLTNIQKPIASRLKNLDDEAVNSLRKGGEIPQPVILTPVPGYRHGMPASLKYGFMGRVEDLWRVFHALETKHMKSTPVSCALVGPGGVGKTQLAAEFAWRYGAKQYPGGVIWINADEDEISIQKQLWRVLETFGADTEGLDRGTHSSYGQENEFNWKYTQIFNAASQGKPVLWIVDNIPVPEKGTAVRPLSYWCPPQQDVKILCTSRRCSIPGTDTTIQLVELMETAAVEMLTQPRVKRSWLQDEDWATITQWVGGLPLALGILNKSLAESFISAQEMLAMAQGSEAALSLDKELQALREEIPAEYLRGVTEAFNASYALLLAHPEFCEAAHLLARISPISIQDTVIDKLAPLNVIGRLASRGWVQALQADSDDASQRYWRMHRLVASYLRTVSASPRKELEVLEKKLSGVYQDDSSIIRHHDYLPHLLYLFDACLTYYNEHPEKDPKHSLLGKRLAMQLATFQLNDPKGEDTRFYAARFLNDLNFGDELAASLKAKYHNGDQEIALGVVRMLPGISDSREAAYLCADMLQDLRFQIRENAMIRSLVFKHCNVIAIPLLDSILSDMKKDFLRLRPQMTTRDTSSQQRSLEDDPFWHLPGSHSVRTALETLGRSFNEGIYMTLTSSLETAKCQLTQLIALNRLALYLRAIDTALPLRISSGRKYDPKHEKTGKAVMYTQIPVEKPKRPGYFEPIMDLIRKSSDWAIVERAILAVTASASGIQVLEDTAYDMLDCQKYSQLIKMADSIVKAIPEYINACWWRGQAYDGLKQLDNALEDYRRVVKITPAFLQGHFFVATLLEDKKEEEAAREVFMKMVKINPYNANEFYWRALAHESLGEPGKAIKDLDEAITLEPDDWNLYLHKTEVLIHLKSFSKAVTVATAGIGKNPENFELWYIRAYARWQSDDLENAMNDAKKSCQLNPDSTKSRKLRDELIQILS